MDDIDQLIKEKKISEKRKTLIKEADLIIIPLSNANGEFINNGSMGIFKKARLNGFRAEYLCESPQKLKAFEHYSETYVILGLIVTNIQVLIWIYKLLKNKELEKYLGSIPIFEKVLYKNNQISNSDTNELLKRLEQIIEKNKK